MGVALTVDGGGSVKSEVAYLPVGAKAIRDHWLPVIESHDLGLLDVAVTGGLTVTPENYPQMVQEVEVPVSKLRESFASGPEGEDIIQRASRLLELLKGTRLRCTRFTLVS